MLIEIEYFLHEFVCVRVFLAKAKMNHRSREKMPYIPCEQFRLRSDSDLSLGCSHHYLIIKRNCVAKRQRVRSNCIVARADMCLLSLQIQIFQAEILIRDIQNLIRFSARCHLFFWILCMTVCPLCDVWQKMGIWDYGNIFSDKPFFYI